MATAATMERGKVGQYADALVESYLSHHAALSIATNPRAAELLPAVEPGQLVPIGKIHDDRGRVVIEYHFSLHLLKASIHDFDVVWLSGALIALGDALDRHRYFERAPCLEMIRHLRHAVAHGNRFNITHPEYLKQYPANTEGLTIGFEDQRVLHITPELDGTALMFDFIEPHEIVSLIQAVGRHLTRPTDA